MAKKGWNPHDHANLSRGKKAEARVRAAYERAGWVTEDYGWGADFKATHRNGKERWVEVKTTSGKLSRRQKAERKKRGRQYHVEYVGDMDVRSSNAMRIRADGHSEMDPWVWAADAER